MTPRATTGLSIRLRKRSPLWGRVEEIRKLAATEPSTKRVLESLGCTVSPGNYATLKRIADASGIVLPDGSGTALAVKKNRFELDSVLVENSQVANFGNLKRRLIGEGRLTSRCDECKIFPEWNGKPLVLQLDHINGIKSDNRIQNLRLLCPNCHSQTDTFCKGNGPYRTKAA